MVQLVVFVLALVAVYAIKAVAVARTHDELAQNSASFSWMSARPEDEATAASWATAEEAESAVQRRVAMGSTGALRRVGA